MLSNQVQDTSNGLRILASQERQDEVEALRRHGRAWDKAMVDLDLDTAVSYFASDAYTIQPNQRPGIELDEIRRVWVEFLALPEFVFTTEPKVIEVSASGDMAYEIGSYIFSFRSPNGQIKDTGHYVLVYKKVDGEWKLAVDIPASELSAQH